VGTAAIAMHPIVKNVLMMCVELATAKNQIEQERMLEIGMDI
jgi:hypothetical protein